MTPDEFRAFGHQLIDWIADYRANHCRATGHGRRRNRAHSSQHCRPNHPLDPNRLTPYFATSNRLSCPV